MSALIGCPLEPEVMRRILNRIPAHVIYDACEPEDRAAVSKWLNEEATGITVTISDYGRGAGSGRMGVIRAIRNSLDPDVGLLQAKKLTDELPVVLTWLGRSEAEHLFDALREIGVECRLDRS